MGEVCIYGLKDPRDGEFYYIGKTVDMERRLEQHLKCDSDNPRKDKWLRSLLATGAKPEVKLLQTTTSHEWRTVEKKWIRRGFDQGWPLTNAPVQGHKKYTGDYTYLQGILTDRLWQRLVDLKGDDLSKRAAGIIALSYVPFALKVEPRTERFLGARVYCALAEVLLNRIDKVGDQAIDEWLEGLSAGHLHLVYHLDISLELE